MSSLPSGPLTPEPEQERNSESRVTGKMWNAVRLLNESGIRYAGVTGVFAPVTGEGTQVADGMVYLNYRTAMALENAGFGRLTGHGEDCEFHLGALPDSPSAASPVPEEQP